MHFSFLLLIQKIIYKIPLQTKQTHWRTKKKQKIKNQCNGQGWNNRTLPLCQLGLLIINNRHILVNLSQKEFIGCVLGSSSSKKLRRGWRIRLGQEPGRQITKSCSKPRMKPARCVTALRVTAQGGTSSTALKSHVHDPFRCQGAALRLQKDLQSAFRLLWSRKVRGSLLPKLKRGLGKALGSWNWVYVSFLRPNFDSSQTRTAFTLTRCLAHISTNSQI